MRISEKLIQYRHKFRLSQEALASKLHVSRQTISNWETGRTYPDIQSLMMLTEIYQIKLDDLIHDDIKEMQDQVSRKKLWRLIMASGAIIVLEYVAFAGLRWFPPIIGMMLISICMTLGLVLMYFLWKSMKALQLRKFRQVLAYLNGNPVSSGASPSRITVIAEDGVGLLIGAGIGSLALWLILKFIINR